MLKIPTCSIIFQIVEYFKNGENSTTKILSSIVASLSVLSTRLSNYHHSSAASVHRVLFWSAYFAFLHIFVLLYRPIILIYAILLLNGRVIRLVRFSTANFVSYIVIGWGRVKWRLNSEVGIELWILPRIFCLSSLHPTHTINVFPFTCSSGFVYTCTDNRTKYCVGSVSVWKCVQKMCKWKQKLKKRKRLCNSKQRKFSIDWKWMFS